MWVSRPVTGTGRPKGLSYGPLYNAERAMFSPSLTPPIVKLCCTPLPHSAEPYSFYLTQRHEAPVVGPGVASSPWPTMAAPGLPERWPICQPDDTSKGCEEQHVEPGSTSPSQCFGRPDHRFSAACWTKGKIPKTSCGCRDIVASDTFHANESRKNISK